MNRNDIINLIGKEFSSYLDVLALLEGEYPVYPDAHRKRTVVAFLVNSFSEYGQWRNVEALRIARELGYEN